MSSTLIKKILIVDDEQAILRSLAQVLTAEGVEVKACKEIEQAEEALKNSQFDLVIADIRMSGIGGIEGLELLSYIKQFFKTEVIIMTGYGSREIEADAYRRGAYHYFTKPVDIPKLLQRVSLLRIPVSRL